MPYIYITHTHIHTHTGIYIYIERLHTYIYIYIYIYILCSNNYNQFVFFHQQSWQVMAVCIPGAQLTDPKVHICFARHAFRGAGQLAVGQNPGTPGEHKNSWDLWMFIPLKMVLIGIDS